MALSFNGSSDYLKYNAAVRNAEPYAISAWFYCTSAVGAVIAQQGNNSSASNLMQMGVTASQEVKIRCRSTTADRTTVTTTTFSLNTWNHALAVFQDISDRRVYLNGGGKNTDGNFVNPSVNNTTIGVWDYGTQTQYFPGYIANVAMWSISPNDTVAAKLAGGMSALHFRPANLLGYWPLIDETDPAHEWVLGRTMTHYGTPSAVAHPPVQTFPALPIEIGNLILPTDLDIYNSPDANFIQVITP